MAKRIQATCPKNPHHQNFLTTAHVMQEWCVGEDGQFLTVRKQCLQVTHGPDVDNIWVCADCGCVAEVKEGF